LEIRVGEVESFYGICLQYSLGCRDDTFGAFESLWPYTIKMPCGSEMVIQNRAEFPIDDVPCPCGNPNHWMIKNEIISLNKS
jgi:hypothetical protein